MQKLMSELGRLYLLKDQQYHELSGASYSHFPAGVLSTALLQGHLRGEKTVAIDLVGGDGLTRALLIDFHGAAGTSGSPHWDLLCEVANALQTELGLPAPAVSISGGNGYGLWLSLETPVPVTQARQFLQLLRTAYFPTVDEKEVSLYPGSGSGSGHGPGSGPDQTLAELPPCLHRSGDNDKWAAFINPGMGASFADEPGLDMPPPSAAQAGFLDGLHSIGAAQFQQALDVLEQRHGAPPAAAIAHLGSSISTPISTAISRSISTSTTATGLLLKDATLEDIVKHLHEKNIEPTFRHLIGR